jgi:protein TonB
MSYAQQSDNSRKRVTGFMIVVLLHAAAVYALVNGLARKIVEVVRPPLETKVLEEVKPPVPPEKLPPPPPPRLVAPPPPYIPPPEVQVQPPPQIQQAAITAVTTIKPAEPPPPIGPAPQAAVAPVRTAAVVDSRGCEKPAYPPASLRANETGTVRLSFLIEADGRIVQSRIEVSSGFRRLDDAARMGLALCKFKPATVDGKPERAWARIDYVWKVE